MKVNLAWATPNGDDIIAYLARVSNPDAKMGEDSRRLIRYLLRNKHVSPFEMANACLEVDAPRDVTRQLLRHRSFSFQEFSGRYAEYKELLDTREGRLQHPANRQSSLVIEDPGVDRHWRSLVNVVRTVCWASYRSALALGIAKEVARALLPEGLVPTKLYVNGTVRSWIHYLAVRREAGTQKEHRDLAESIYEVLRAEFPATFEAAKDVIDV